MRHTFNTIRRAAVAGCLCLAAGPIGLSAPQSMANDSYPGAIDDLRSAKGAGKIAEAWLADPTQRYRHFVLGSQYEPETIAVRLRNGEILTLTLPPNSVFEDRQPRLADLTGDGVDEIVLVRSYIDSGAALAVVGLVENTLQVIAETPPTGRPNTWLNPAGIADFNGDGRTEVAYVQMPHVLGLLRVWTLVKAGAPGTTGKSSGTYAFREIATLSNTSNHVYGSPELGLSAVGDFNGDGTPDLAVPSKDLKTIRFLRLTDQWQEFDRVKLKSRIAEDFDAISTSAGRWVIIGKRKAGNLPRRYTDY